jgi:hypothetical protein
MKWPKRLSVDAHLALDEPLRLRVHSLQLGDLGLVQIIAYDSVTHELLVKPVGKVTG